MGLFVAWTYLSIHFPYLWDFCGSSVFQVLCRTAGCPAAKLGGGRLLGMGAIQRTPWILLK